MEFYENIKIFLIDEACLCILFQRNFHCMLQNKTRKQTQSPFFSWQNNVKSQKYSISLQALVMLELILILVFTVCIDLSARKLNIFTLGIGSVCTG